MLTIDIYMDYFHNPIMNEDFFFTVESISNQMSRHSEHFSGFLFFQTKTVLSIMAV